MKILPHHLSIIWIEGQRWRVIATKSTSISWSLWRMSLRCSEEFLVEVSPLCHSRATMITTIVDEVRWFSMRRKWASYSNYKHIRFHYWQLYLSACHFSPLQLDLDHSIFEFHLRALKFSVASFSFTTDVIDFLLLLAWSTKIIDWSCL